MDNFYKSAVWKNKRAYILKRDLYLCQECKRYGKRIEGTIVHHIIPYEDAPELSLKNDNLITLCKMCHNKKHPEKGGKR